MVNAAAALMGGLSSIIKSSTLARLKNTVLVRAYSVYPSYYIKPTFKKDEQINLERTQEAKDIAHVPILPAHPSDTSSEFHNEQVAKFTNYIMRKGKKQLARDMLEHAFMNIKRIQLKRYHSTKPEQRSGIELDPTEILRKAVENSKPVMELLKMKRGGITYQVPVPILEHKQRFLAMNWLIQAAKDKHRRIHLPESLAKELIDAAYNQGRVIKKKHDLHKQCEANRAYAHYRWT